MGLGGLRRALTQLRQRRRAAAWFAAVPPHFRPRPFRRSSTGRCIRRQFCNRNGLRRCNCRCKCSSCRCNQGCSNSFWFRLCSLFSLIVMRLGPSVSGRVPATFREAVPWVRRLWRHSWHNGQSRKVRVAGKKPGSAIWDLERCAPRFHWQPGLRLGRMGTRAHIGMGYNGIGLAGTAQRELWQLNPPGQ